MKNTEVQTLPMVVHQPTKSFNSHFEEATPRTYQVRNSGVESSTGDDVL